MNYLRQVQKGIDYIETQLESDIVSRDVALHAGMSQWHFQRIFKALTNETLMTYIRARRLANSLDMLLNTDLRVVDISMSAGYENQESFTRAFRKSFGMTPIEYRKIGDRALFLKKVELDADYIRHINTNLSLEPTVVLKPRRRLIGMNTMFYGSDSDKNNFALKLPTLWGEFLPRLHEVEGTLGTNCYGAIQHVSESSDQLSYVAGIEVEASATIPAGMVEFFVPESRYAIFTHDGPVPQLDNTVNYIYSNWLLGSDYQHSYGPDLEVYGPQYDPNSNTSVMHYAIPLSS